MGLSEVVGTNGSPQSQNGVTYADHWSDGDPYTHNLLVHRFGITAEQLDGFLDTLGISHDKNRINGKSSSNGKLNLILMFVESLRSH